MRLIPKASSHLGSFSRVFRVRALAPAAPAATRWSRRAQPEVYAAKVMRKEKRDEVEEALKTFLVKFFELCLILRSQQKHKKHHLVILVPKKQKIK